MQTFLTEADMVCNDLCLMITQRGDMVYGELSQDCGRFRHFDLGSLDKDVWRSGGSPEQVLDKWRLQSELLEAGAAKCHELRVSPLPIELSNRHLTLTLGTTNPFKVREISSILAHLHGVKLVVADPAEVEEPHNDFVRNARVKALYHAATTDGLAMGEDSGISVDALHGLPGPRSARFDDFADVDPATGVLGGYKASGRTREVIDEANNSRLLKLMTDVPETDRGATLTVAIAIAVCGKILFETTATGRGSIVPGDEPKGRGGFGYDPVYVPSHTGGLTFAQLDSVRKNLRSFRQRALQDVARWLVGQLAESPPMQAS